MEGLANKHCGCNISFVRSPGHLITRIVIIAGWISVIAVGAMLRFEHLSTRPIHPDEATGARLAAKRMEPDGYRFDPAHFHGPVQSLLIAPLCRLRGEDGWKGMTKGSLRLLPATAGTLLLLVPLIGRRRWGDGPMLLAAALMASSPLLVYYSRMFIHEMLLVLFGVLIIFCVVAKPRYVLAGILMGLMFATKESAAISILSWGGAGLLVALEYRRSITSEHLGVIWRERRVPVLLLLLSAAGTAVLLYTNFFQRPQGALDAVRTFFVYKTGEGHDKAAGYYLGFLLWPSWSGGRWWYETPVFALAVLAVASTFGKAARDDPRRPVIHFLAWASVGHFLIYSCIAYKTPWLVCLPWAHVCLLAGFSLWRFAGWRPIAKVACGLVIAACLILQVRQARWATGRFAADARNPYAYVPTSFDIEDVESWLVRLGRGMPDGVSLEPVAVVGSQYWPLPWYLRDFDRIGYWPEPDAALDRLPLVFALPEVADALMAQLADTHTASPRTLRSEVPVYLFVRNDVWQHWMESD